jgi:hypothetical protein
MSFVVDADDFCEENNDLDRIMRIHERNSRFRITLFTIPGRCSVGFIREMQRFEWVEMVPHGWMHPDPRECEAWTLADAREYLCGIEAFGLVRGFKAPGWQISDPTYQALIEAGYWVADQAYNDQRRPPELRAYVLGPKSIHCHVGHLGGHNANALEYVEDLLMAAECRLVTEELGLR